MATYTVTARRTGDWWALEVPGVPGAHSQCKRLDQAADMAREAIAMVLDTDEADIEVEVHPQLPPKMDELVASFRRAVDPDVHAQQRPVGLGRRPSRRLERGQVAADRSERDLWADHRARLELGIVPVTTAPVVAQVSRSGRQAQPSPHWRSPRSSSQPSPEQSGAGRSAGLVDDAVGVALLGQAPYPLLPWKV